MQGQIDGLENNISRLEDKIARLEREVDDLKRQVDYLEYTRIPDEVRSLQSDIERAQHTQTW